MQGVPCCIKLKGNQFQFNKYLMLLINENHVMNGRSSDVDFHLKQTESIKLFAPWTPWYSFN